MERSTQDCNEKPCSQSIQSKSKEVILIDNDTKSPNNSPMDINHSGNEAICWTADLIWTQPARQLPGPEEHPMLKQLLAAIKDKASDTVSTYGSDAVYPVHPYIPHPSLGMANTSDHCIYKTVNSARNQSEQPIPEEESILQPTSTCSLQYYRVTNMSKLPIRVLHGQIWKGGKRRKRWRRHQWMVLS